MKIRVGVVVAFVMGFSGCGIDRSREGKRGEVGGAQFLVASIRATETLISKISPMGLPEEKLFNIQACMQDRLGLAPIVDREFRVWAEGDVLQLRSDIRGCITWQEHHSYNYLEDEAYFSVERRIEGVSGFHGVETLSLKMNPWKDGGSALIDSRYDQVPHEVSGQKISFKSRISRVSEKSSALKVKTVSFHLRRYRPDLYRLKKDLGLELAHEYEFRTTVQFLRRTLQGQTTETPYRGRLRVHGYLVRQPIPVGGEVRELVASFNDEVEIHEDGLVNHPLIMTIHDPVAYTSRTYFYITIEPVDDTNLAPIDMMGIDDPHGPFNVQLRPVDQDIIDLFSKKKSQIAAEVPDLYRQLASHDEIQEIQPEAGSDLSKFSDYLSQATKKGAKNPLSQQMLCEALFQGEENKEARETCLCKSSEAGFWKRWFGCPSSKTFDTQIRDVVVDVESQPEILTGPVNESLNISASFERSTSNSTQSGTRESTLWSVRTSAGVSTGFDALEMFSSGIVKAPLSVGLSFDASSESFKAKAQTTSESRDSGVKQSSSVNYEGESYQLGYQASVRRCAFFEVSGLAQGLSSARRMVCSPVFSRDVKQTYYFVNMETKRDSVITDAAAQDARKHFVVRGKASYQALTQILADKNIKILYDRHEPLGDLDSSNLTEEYPGLLMPAGDD